MSTARLSNLIALQGGRNSNNTTNVYLRGPDGLPMNQAGYVVPRDMTIIGLAAATNGVHTWTAEVRKNGSATVIASLVLTAVAKLSTFALNVAVSAGDELQFYCNGSSINSPLMVVYLR